MAITKGETLTLTVSDELATAVEYRFGGPQTRAIAAPKSSAKNSKEFLLTAPTATWTPGLYRYQAWATYSDLTSKVIDSGTIDLLDVLGIGDQRSQARKNVEAIETQMAGNAAEAVRKYKINNRELERYSVSELMVMLSYWRQRMLREDRRHNGLSSLGPRIAVRF